MGIKLNWFINRYVVKFNIIFTELKQSNTICSNYLFIWFSAKECYNKVFIFNNS